MQYALLSYSTTNLGDEIQSIAARQFLPAINLYVDRDQPQRVPPDLNGPCKLIFNGWHTRNPENWPPSPNLAPLLISIHLTATLHPVNAQKLVPSTVLLEGASLEFFRAHAPIGARDLWTLELLQAKNIDAYFSACLTLTLGTDDDRPRGDYICAVDLPPRVLEALRARAGCPVVSTTHRDDAGGTTEQKMLRAERLLNLYAHAKAVVATRLHCAMPCLALQTPVLFLPWAKDGYRFTGLKKLVRSCTVDEFIGNRFDFDFRYPQPNADAYRTFRRDLLRRTGHFVDSAGGNHLLHPFRPQAISP